MGAPKITNGKDFNFFQKVSVNWSAFGGGAANNSDADLAITFVTQGILLLNEDSANVVEYSFNGNTIHGELNPTLPSRGISFDNRVVSSIWFRVKAGSSGPISVRVDAWAR